MCIVYDIDLVPHHQGWLLLLAIMVHASVLDVNLVILLQHLDLGRILLQASTLLDLPSNRVIICNSPLIFTRLAAYNNITTGLHTLTL